MTEEEESQLLKPIEPQEIQRVIGEGRAEVAPGPDGLGYAFYEESAYLLAEPMVEAFNAALNEKGSFFGGYLNLIYKDVGDPYLLTNCRPINASNVDYRIWAKVLHNRLAVWAPHLISEGQTSVVPGHRVGESLRAIREIFTMVRRASGAVE